MPSAYTWVKLTPPVASAVPGDGPEAVPLCVEVTAYGPFAVSPVTVSVCSVPNVTVGPGSIVATQGGVWSLGGRTSMDGPAPGR